MKRLREQNGRKSLEGQAFLYINNNSSFHHKGARMPTHTRARETPCDVLQYCGIRFWLFSASHYLSVLGAICEPRIGPVSLPYGVLRPNPNRYFKRVVWAFCGVWCGVPNWHSKFVLAWVLPVIFAFLGGVGTVANPQRVCFVGRNTHLSDVIPTPSIRKEARMK